MSGTLIQCAWFKEDPLRKKTSRVKMAKDIVASVRKEMDQPRLTESVRQALSSHAAVAVEKPAAGEHRLNTNH